MLKAAIKATGIIIKKIKKTGANINICFLFAFFIILLFSEKYHVIDFKKTEQSY